MNYEMIGASRCGKKHAENQDRIVRRVLSTEDAANPACLIAVVDGVSSSAFGASVARWIAETHLDSDQILDPTRGNVAEQLRGYLSQLHQRFRDEFEDLAEMLTSAASIGVAVAAENTAHVLWAGDSPVYMTDCREQSYKTARISFPHVDPKGALVKCFRGDSPFEFDYRELTIQPGDIVTMTSDGAVHEETMLNELYQREGFDERVCHEVVETALRQPHSDDVSIVACRCV